MLKGLSFDGQRRRLRRENSRAEAIEPRRVLSSKMHGQKAHSAACKGTCSPETHSSLKACAWSIRRSTMERSNRSVGGATRVVFCGVLFHLAVHSYLLSPDPAGDMNCAKGVAFNSAGYHRRSVWVLVGGFASDVPQRRSKRIASRRRQKRREVVQAGPNTAKRKKKVNAQDIRESQGAGNEYMADFFEPQEILTTAPALRSEQRRTTNATAPRQMTPGPSLMHSSTQKRNTSSSRARERGPRRPSKRRQSAASGINATNGLQTGGRPSGEALLRNQSRTGGVSFSRVGMHGTHDREAASLLSSPPDASAALEQRLNSVRPAGSLQRTEAHHSQLSPTRLVSPPEWGHSDLSALAAWAIRQNRQRRNPGALTGVVSRPPPKKRIEARVLEDDSHYGHADDSGRPQLLSDEEAHGGIPKNTLRLPFRKRTEARILGGDDHYTHANFGLPQLLSDDKYAQQETRGEIATHVSLSPPRKHSEARFLGGDGHDTRADDSGRPQHLSDHRYAKQETGGEILTNQSRPTVLVMRSRGVAKPAYADGAQLCATGSAGSPLNPEYITVPFTGRQSGEDKRSREDNEVVETASARQEPRPKRACPHTACQGHGARSPLAPSAAPSHLSRPPSSGEFGFQESEEKQRITTGHCEGSEEQEELKTPEGQSGVIHLEGKKATKKVPFDRGKAASVLAALRTFLQKSRNHGTDASGQQGDRSSKSAHATEMASEEQALLPGESRQMSDAGLCTAQPAAMARHPSSSSSSTTDARTFSTSRSVHEAKTSCGEAYSNCETETAPSESRRERVAAASYQGQIDPQSLREAFEKIAEVKAGLNNLHTLQRESLMVLTNERNSLKFALAQTLSYLDSLPGEQREDSGELTVKPLQAADQIQCPPCTPHASTAPSVESPQSRGVPAAGHTRDFLGGVFQQRSRTFRGAQNQENVLRDAYTFTLCPTESLHAPSAEQCRSVALSPAVQASAGRGFASTSRSHFAGRLTSDSRPTPRHSARARRRRQLLSSARLSSSSSPQSRSAAVSSSASARFRGNKFQVGPCTEFTETVRGDSVLGAGEREFFITPAATGSTAALEDGSSGSYAPAKQRLHLNRVNDDTRFLQYPTAAAPAFGYAFTTDEGANLMPCPFVEPTTQQSTTASPSHADVVLQAMRHSSLENLVTNVASGESQHDKGVTSFIPVVHSVGGFVRPESTTGATGPPFFAQATRSSPAGDVSLQEAGSTRVSRANTHQSTTSRQTGMSTGDVSAGVTLDASPFRPIVAAQDQWFQGSAPQEETTIVCPAVLRPRVTMHPPPSTGTASGMTHLLAPPSDVTNPFQAAHNTPGDMDRYPRNIASGSAVASDTHRQLFGASGGFTTTATPAGSAATADTYCEALAAPRRTTAILPGAGEADSDGSTSGPLFKNSQETRQLIFDAPLEVTESPVLARPRDTNATTEQDGPDPSWQMDSQDVSHPELRTTEGGGNTSGPLSKNRQATRQLTSDAPPKAIKCPLLARLLGVNAERGGVAPTTVQDRPDSSRQVDLQNFSHPEPRTTKSDRSISGRFFKNSQATRQLNFDAPSEKTDSSLLARLLDINAQRSGVAPKTKQDGPATSGHTDPQNDSDSTPQGVPRTQ